jgi:hypothetical protein
MRVRKIRNLPEPDRSWMKDYDGKFDKEELFGWMGK